MKNCAPIIGLTSSYNQKNKRIQLLNNYFTSIRHFGGIPLLIPVGAEDAELEVLIGMCDGILLTGGSDIDPAYFDDQVLNDTVELPPERDKTEFSVCHLATQQEKPMLGICRGIQMMNVFFGGTLYQDIPTQVPSDIQHRMEKPYHRTCHNCLLTEGSPLHALTGKAVIGVNSHHHQAIKDIAPGFSPMGSSEDGVIEAIWNPSKPFLWGVQWHPERIWDIEDSSAKVFEAFMTACQ